jgi:hypothetical protein
MRQVAFAVRIEWRGRRSARERERPGHRKRRSDLPRRRLIAHHDVHLVAPPPECHVRRGAAAAEALEARPPDCAQRLQGRAPPSDSPGVEILAAPPADDHDDRPARRDPVGRHLACHHPRPDAGRPGHEQRQGVGDRARRRRHAMPVRGHPHPDAPGSHDSPPTGERDRERDGSKRRGDQGIHGHGHTAYAGPPPGGPDPRSATLPLSPDPAPRLLPGRAPLGRAEKPDREAPCR